MKRPTQILIQKGETRFRREVLLQAQQLIVAIDHTEDELEVFERQDQPGYREWLEYNFADKCGKLSALERDYTETIRFHNWVVAESRMRRITMANAYGKIRVEAQQYREADALARERIELDRRERENFVQLECGTEDFTTSAEPALFAPPTTASSESLKSVYRKLVRRLHPDLLGQENDSAELRWQKRVWNTAQVARRDGHLQELELLYKVTLLRQLELKELTIADAHEVHDWLAKELERLRVELNQARKNLAWNFSRKSISAQFQRDVEEYLNREIQALETELEDIKGQHAYLEVISQTQETLPTREIKVRKRRQKPVHQDDLQLSLF
jgi:hypothetical protein